jgi:hypothetical protein
VKLLTAALLKAAAAAETLTGKKFALLVASSLVATSGIVAVGANSSSGMSPMEAAALQALAEQESTLAAAPAEPEESFTPASSPEPAASSGPVASAPAPAPVASEPAPAPEPETPVVPPSEPEAPEPGPIQHVFLISLASPGYDASFGSASQMPDLSATLRPQGVLLTDYSLVDTAPLPNGIATISGQPPSAATKAGCPRYEECVQEVETLTLSDQLVGARLHWHGYIEGMQNPEAKPESCVQPEPEAAVAPAPSGYSPLLNPFIFFHSLLDLGDCDENDVPLDKLAGDLKKVEKTANFSYIAPSLCNAGFRGNCPEGTPDGAAAADAFLAKVVPEILASPAYKKDGLLIVNFGAADPAAAADPATAPANPSKVGAVLVSPLLTPGGTDAVAYNPYSVLRSIEDLFALDPLGKAAGAKVKSFSGAFLTANGGD